MADLSVQPKKKTAPLPWILLLLGLAALVWFLLRNNGPHREAPTGPAGTTINSAPAPAAGSNKQNNTAQ